jgi:hypothetical protein
LRLRDQRDAGWRYAPVRLVAGAWAGRDAAHRGANCLRDLLFQAKGHDCPSAWDAKVDQHAAEQALQDVQALVHQGVLGWMRRREQELPNEMQPQELKQQGARRKVAYSCEPADWLAAELFVSLSEWCEPQALAWLLPVRRRAWPLQDVAWKLAQWLVLARLALRPETPKQEQAGERASRREQPQQELQLQLES